MRGHQAEELARRRGGRRSGAASTSSSRASAASASSIASMHDSMSSTLAHVAARRARARSRRDRLDRAATSSRARGAARAASRTGASCATVFGPTTTAVTSGDLQEPGEWRARRATRRAPAARRSSSSSASNVASVRKRSLPSGRIVMREPARRRLAAAVLAGQPAAGERAVRRVPEAVLVTEREDRLAVVLDEQRERVLHPLVAGEPLEGRELERLGELVGGEVRGADRADEAVADEVVERLQRLLLRHVRVEVVGEVERDALEPEPAQARLELPPDARRAGGRGRLPRSSG